MKRLAIVPLLAVLAFAPASAEGTDFSVTGTIAVAGPQSRLTGGLTEIGSPCLGSPPDAEEVPPGALQGVDGYWIQLPPDGLFDGLKATLVADGGNDVDAWFYGGGCNLILEPEATAYSMAGDPIPTGLPAPGPDSIDFAPDGDELNGTIPDGAEWVIVDLYVGANATFTFTVDNVTDGDGS